MPKDSADAAPAIQTVQRVAAILDAFTTGSPRLTLAETVGRLGVSRSTAHRYAKALCAANLLRYDQRTALYSLSPRILSLAAAARAGLPIVATAEPFMNRLLADTDETVVLSVWDGEAPTVLRCADNTDRTIGISVRTGSRLDLTTTAQGKVFCAYLPAEQVPGMARLLRRSPALRAELAAIRDTGLAVNSTNGVRSIAAPVFQSGSVTAAMAVIGATVNVPDDAGSPIAKALAAAARALSEHLGSSSPAGDAHEPINLR
ncbi:IclR family transcriptional regulator [Rhizohabitans arisaemae]|uniref:IclR family transcriptional regulator n=1 Tax=Rhizohabitans arisaemae TaxID=2720610 RepID=UPI0024B0C3D3|nr:IclR family transcriptional regulator [Rhizohabitans arisaemae]